MEQSASVGPAFLGVRGPLGCCPIGSGVGQSVGVPVFDGPAEEMAGFVPVAGGGRGDPAVEVGLGAGVECQCVVAEPVEKVRRGGDMAAHVQVLEAGGVVFAEALPQSA